MSRDDLLRLLIADDHPLFRRGMREYLDGVAGLSVVGVAADGETAIEMCRDLLPDVVLMDLQMPNGTGIDATREIVATVSTVRVLIVTLFEDDDSVFAALRAGARGYVLKDADEDELVRAIRAVANGEAIFSPVVATRVLNFLTSPRREQHVPFPALTEREREILDLMATGHNNASIARQLSISSKTVANHVSNIFGKLQVADRAEAIVRAINAGLGRP